MQYWFDFAATTCWVVARNLHMELHGPRKRSVPRSRRRDAACRTVCYLIAWKLRRLDDLRTTDELDFLDPCFVRTRRALIRALSDIYVYCSLLWGWESCIFCTRRYIPFSLLRYDPWITMAESMIDESFGIRYFLIDWQIVADFYSTVSKSERFSMSSYYFVSRRMKAMKWIEKALIGVANIHLFTRDARWKINLKKKCIFYNWIEIRVVQRPLFILFISFVYLFTRSRIYLFVHFRFICVLSFVSWRSVIYTKYTRQKVWISTRASFQID